MSANDLSDFDASTLMRWYAQMNAWGTPSDLPEGMAEADFEPCRDYKARFPKWAATMRAIQGRLSDQQMSWGWWREQKIGDFEAWSRWWKNVRIDANGETTKARP